MKIYLAGKNGLVGTSFSIYYGNKEVEFCTTESREVDLRNFEAIKSYLNRTKPDVLILSAAKHGGVQEYALHPLEYYKENLLISINTINAAAECGVKTLINIGASCIYAENLKGPLTEDMLFQGAVQKATEPYGFAKAAGMKLCEYYNTCIGLRYISVLPVNLYGNGLGYQTDLSTFIPSLMSRFYNAILEGKQEVDIWGTGENKREFLHVNDFVKAIDIILESDFTEPYLNIGSGTQFTINEIADIIRQISGYSGEIIHDLSKPNGAQRNMLDCSKLHELGWKPEINLRKGLQELYSNLYKEQ